MQTGYSLDSGETQGNAVRTVSCTTNLCLSVRIHVDCFRKPNIFDNMLAIMEKYAYNLEGLVQERTNLLYEEKKKTETLLLRMLPK